MSPIEDKKYNILYYRGNHPLHQIYYNLYITHIKEELIMIIIMARDFDHMRGGNALCQRYYGGDVAQVVLFDADCFSNLKNSRVTFLGHADSTKFGGFSAEAFVDKLTNSYWKAVLPKTVTDIDLIGCEIGFITQGESYLKRVAQLLGEKGYEVRIHAFSNLKTNPDLVGMLVYVHDNGNAYVTGWTKKNEDVVNSLEYQLSNLYKEKNQFDQKILELQGKIKDKTGKTHLIALYEQSMSENDKRISSLNDKITQLKSISTPSTEQAKDEQEPNEIEKIGKKIVKLKQENERSSKSIEEVKKEIYDAREYIAKKEKSITSYSTLSQDSETKIIETIKKLRVAQNEVVIINPSPLREILDSDEIYQITTKSTVQKKVIPLSTSVPPNTVASSLEGATFSFQAHRIWQSDTADSKWGKDKFSGPESAPPLPAPKLDDNSVKTKVEKQGQPSNPTDESYSIPRLGKP